MSNVAKTLMDSKWIKKIHALKSALKMTDEEYRKLINLNYYPANSSKELTDKQTARFIEWLEETAIQKGVWQKYEGKRKYENLGYRAGMGTPKQLRLIEGLWKDVSVIKESRARQKALRAWLHKRFGISDPRFLNREVTSKVIYALNQMKKAETRNRTESHIKSSGGVR